MSAVLVPRIEGRIQIVRGLRVIVDVDLATLYGVQTKRLNEQVKRNRERFPSDFLFQLNAAEKAEVVANCDHLQKLKFSKVPPYAFTEHGAIQAANVLASSQAVEMGIYVVRAFVHLREATAARAKQATYRVCAPARYYWCTSMTSTSLNITFLPSGNIDINSSLSKWNFLGTYAHQKSLPHRSQFLKIFHRPDHRLSVRTRGTKAIDKLCRWHERG